MARNYRLPVLLSLLITLCSTVSLHPQVVINEYSASNLSQFQDNYQRYEDWFELYNTSSSPFNLGGYYLSDRAGNPFKWQIPEGTAIPANGFLRFWTSGRDEVSGTHFHTNFKLTQTKDSPDYVILSNPFGTTLDSIRLEITQLGHSRGRKPNGAVDWFVFTNPTPGTSNDAAQAYIRYSERPQMSLEAGFYASAQEVEITTNETGAAIRFTTNGNVPTESSTLYTGPISVTNTLLVQARVFHSDPQVLPGLIEFNTYFVDEAHTLPVISVSGNQLLQLLNGNASLRPHGTFEYFNSDKERTTAGYGEFNKHGQDSWVNPQRSIDYITRDEMGYNYAIREAMIPITDRDEFQRIILRVCGDDNYPGKDTAAHMRDIWTQNLAEMSGMHLDVRKGARCIMYANGEYWGVYSTREKVDDHDFTNYYYNQDKYNIQFLKYWGSLWAEYGGQQAINDWMTLRNYILSSNVNDPFVWDQINAQYDYKSLVDYVIINSFVVCSDWLNWNVGIWRGLHPEGGHQKWGYILWDEDAILGHYINYTGIPGQHPWVPPCFPEYLSSWSDPQKHIEILNKLKENPEFYQYYISRYIDFSNTVFLKEDLLHSIDSMAAVIAPEMPRHVSRWYGNMPKWEANVQKMRNFVSDRCDYLPTGLKECYNLSGPYPITLGVEPEGVGSINLNSLNLNKFPWTGNYYGGIDVKLAAEATNFNYEFDYWELVNHTPFPNANSESITISLTGFDIVIAHFKPKLYTDSLVINEINYRSAGWFNPEDWVEFFNPHDYDLDITDWVFKDDNDNHAFLFPPNTVINANSYLVLCRDTAAFTIHFPQVTNFIGNIDFGFSSNGELLRIYNPEGILIDTVHYGITDPWPPEPYGGGPTLELIHPLLDNAQGENWMASALYGSPGAMNSLLVNNPDISLHHPKLEISVFPNPARTSANIYTHNHYYIQDGVMRMLNSFGNEVLFIENIQSDNFEFNVDGLPEGLFIIKLYDLATNLSTTVKMVVQR
jgi:hypothetical protein